MSTKPGVTSRPSAIDLAPRRPEAMPDRGDAIARDGDIGGAL
jgi:hypothetical protein